MVRVLLSMEIFFTPLSFSYYSDLFFMHLKTPHLSSEQIVGVFHMSIVIQIAQSLEKHSSVMETEDGIEFVKCMSLQNANESVDRKIFALAKILFVFFFFPLYFCLALLDLAERQSGK